MTDADEALLWAREDYAKQFRSRRSHVADSILSGFWDIEVEVSLPARGYRAGAAASAERIKELEARVAELEAALVKANEPEWFYRADDAVPEHSLEDAIEEFCDYLEPGWHFVEIDTARPCKTIRGVVHILTDEEIEARRDDEPWVFTPCATEAEARALLKEPRDD